MELTVAVSDFHIGGGVDDDFENFYFDDEFAFLLDVLRAKRDLYDEITLVLNGDFLELGVFPWLEEPPQQITEELVVKRMHHVFHGHESLFDALASFAALDDVNVVYVIGNHDAGLHFPRAQDALKKRLPGVRVEPVAYQNDGVYVEHGNNYFFQVRINPDVVVQVNEQGERFLNVPWGIHLVSNFLPKLRRWYPHVDKIEPFDTYFKWMLKKRPARTVHALLAFIGFFAWNWLFGDAYTRQWFRPTRKNLRGATLTGELSAVAKQKVAEEGFETVIFGHTHTPRFKEFTAGSYINTGTWTESIHLEELAPHVKTRLTYAVVEHGDGVCKPALHELEPRMTRFEPGALKTLFP